MSALPTLAHLYGLEMSGREHMAALKAFWDFFYQGVGQQAATELTIDAGAIVPTHSEHVVDTEGDASTDDLTTIETTNLLAGRLLYLRAAHTDRSVVLKHNAGAGARILLQDGSDFTLDDDKKGVMLKRIGDDWVELWRNAGAGASLVNNQVTNAILRDSAALSVIGRAANSSGDPADIVAGANDRVLRRVSDALEFGQLTAGMIPSGLLTFAMLASAALAANSDLWAATASKLLTAEAAMAAADQVALTDGATISVDLATGFYFGGTSNAALLLGGDRTLGSPSNFKRQSGYFWFGATGATRQLTLHANYKPVEGLEAFPISIATSETVMLPYIALGSSEIVITGVLRR